ncbi:MAG: glutamine amidotransferase-related protein, partial [Nitrososphaera sp.]
MNTDNSLAVIDLGGQYCHLISRRLRDLDVWSDIFDSNVAPDALAGYAGVILSGGPRSVYDEDAPTVDPKILELGVPVLGICYGHQL